MRQFQLEEYTQDINAAIPDDVRLLSDDDINLYVSIFFFLCLFLLLWTIVRNN